MNVRRNAVAMIAALSLALSVTGAVFAASETVTVNPSQTFSGAPATIAYPAGNAGSTVTATGYAITAGTSNSPNGYTVNANFSNLTKSGGTIPVSAHLVMLTGSVQSNTTKNNSYTGPIGSDFWQPTAGVDDYLFKSTSPQATNDVVTVTNALAIPAGQLPGAYTGTATFTFVLN